MAPPPGQCKVCSKAARLRRRIRALCWAAFNVSPGFLWILFACILRWSAVVAEGEEEGRFLAEGDISDPFAYLIDARTMQPIYFLPVSNGIKQLVTFYIFGFDLKFEPIRGTKEWKTLKWIGSTLFRSAFCILASNTVFMDAKRFNARAEYCQTHWQLVCALAAVWCSSPNFAAGLGMWSQYRIQSPAAVFYEDIEETQYWFLHLPCCGRELFRYYGSVKFPTCLAGAAWLTVSKQIYSYILFPYVLPVVVLEPLLTVISGYWVIAKTQCQCVLACLQCHCTVLLLIWLWLVSLGQRHYLGDRIDRAWQQAWPFVYMYGVWIFATFIVPYLIGALYGVGKCADRKTIANGLGMAKCCRKQHASKGEESEEDSWLKSETSNLSEEDSDSRSEDGDGLCPLLAGIKSCCKKCCGCVIMLMKLFWQSLGIQERIHLDYEDRQLLLSLDATKLSSDFKFRDDSDANSCWRRMMKQEQFYDGEDAEMLGADMGEADNLEEAMAKRGEARRLAAAEGRAEAECCKCDCCECCKCCEGCRCCLPGGRKKERRLFDVLVGPAVWNDGDPDVDDNEALQMKLASSNLLSAQIAIVRLTVKAIAQVAVIQAFIIFFIRSMSSNNFEGLIGAMKITIEERHIATWWDHILTVGEQQIGHALNTVWSA
eukprot:TRINITY_DN33097_c0_g1_i1.p1 TRINITY_DN33097_c0_g1~~TRINITY_DN33097_c0_g1_i1.p1  ORF type:complete len:656 (+),score=89.96 TRINITY_DN33097_c0_g1_i1:45-2012(+)